LKELEVIRDGERIKLVEHEKQRDAYVEQLVAASESLRYLKVSAGDEPVIYWRVDRKGGDIQPALKCLSRDEGKRIADESINMSSSE
jgi:hypothetical protein